MEYFEALIFSNKVFHLFFKKARPCITFVFLNTIVREPDPDPQEVVSKIWNPVKIKFLEL
jgi:hypothetical protein